MIYNNTGIKWIIIFFFVFIVQLVIDLYNYIIPVHVDIFFNIKSACKRLREDLASLPVQTCSVSFIHRLLYI